MHKAREKDGIMLYELKSDYSRIEILYVHNMSLSQNLS